MSEEVKLDTLARISVKDILSWNDAKCKEMDSCIHIPLVEIKNMIKAVIKETEKLRKINDAVKSGEMQGYIIVCPNCGVKYTVLTHELNRGVDITCQDCGCSYRQDKNIVGISCTLPNSSNVDILG